MFEARPPWHQHALCNTGDAALVDVFFGAGQRDFDGERAKQICAQCTVRHECLEAGLAHLPSNDFGVWGGTTAEERYWVRRRRSRTS